MSEVSNIERIDAPREDGSVADAVTIETAAEVVPIIETPATPAPEQLTTSEAQKAAALRQYGQVITTMRNKEVLSRAA